MATKNSYQKSVTMRAPGKPAPSPITEMNRYPVHPTNSGRAKPPKPPSPDACNSTLNSRPKVLKGKTSKFPDAAAAAAAIGRERIVAKLLFALNNVHSLTHTPTHTHIRCIHSLRLSPQPEPFWPQALTQLYRIPAKKFLYEVNARCQRRRG